MFQSWRRRFECGPQWKCDKRQGNDYQHIPLSDHIHLFILPPNIQYLSLTELYAKTICVWHTFSLIFNQCFDFQENSVEAYEEENYRPKDILANLTIGWSPSIKIILSTHLIVITKKISKIDKVSTMPMTMTTITVWQVTSLLTSH